MWPFSKEPSYEEEKSFYEASEAKLLAFRKPGERFWFSGVRLSVACVERVDLGYCTYVPRLQCWYRDNNGQLFRMTFEVCDLPALYAQNPVKKAKGK